MTSKMMSDRPENLILSRWKPGLAIRIEFPTSSPSGMRPPPFSCSGKWVGYTLVKCFEILIIIRNEL